MAQHVVEDKIIDVLERICKALELLALGWKTFRAEVAPTPTEPRREESV